MINYNLKRSKRKTTSICVKNGVVTVSAPLNLPIEQIEKFVKSKESWIRTKLATSMILKNMRKKHTISYSDLLYYRGKQYPISVKEGNEVGFNGIHFYLPPDLPPNIIKECCIGIYKALAKKYLPQRTDQYAKQMNLQYNSVKINSAKTRWGSCSGKGNINYAWRLIMADDDLIDYVVVHELAHIYALSHSPRFWGLVEQVLPDFRDRRKRLRDLESRLHGEDWS